jgi:hypothetical protein
VAPCHHSVVPVSVMCSASLVTVLVCHLPMPVTMCCVTVVDSFSCAWKAYQ